METTANEDASESYTIEARTWSGSAGISFSAWPSATNIKSKVAYEEAAEECGEMSLSGCQISGLLIGHVSKKFLSKKADGVPDVLRAI